MMAAGRDIWCIAVFLLGADGVVGSFLGDINIVRMAFLQTGAGDADKLTLELEFFDVVCAAVSHTRAQAAHQLIYRVADLSLVRNTALDAFGDMLPCAELEVSVARALGHSGH